MTSLHDSLLKMGKDARSAARTLALTPSHQKTQALEAIAKNIRDFKDNILSANAKDIENARKNGMSAALVDRLLLDEKRVLSIADAVHTIANLPDPVGEIMSEWKRPNGLQIQRVRTPLGVIGVIYESRPNVTADAGALCLKAGNAVILRGGSDSFLSSKAIHEAMVEGLKSANLPEKSIQFVDTVDRDAVGELLTGLDGNIDVIVPRGGKSLVARVQREARVPVFSHLEGLCHIYIDKSADLDMAKKIVINAKLRRTGICGAVETILVDRKIADKIVPVIIALQQAGCEIRASEDLVDKIPGAKLATEADWSTEYLDAIVSIKTVEGVEGAIEHINRYSSHHTESIIAEDKKTVELFFKSLDSAILMHNASTQFADGGEFGFGGEIGIATGKMHARGPIGVEQLTTFQYHVNGNGQIRP
ncbi:MULTISPECIES: glutamate-5-semialdehyde dehydrogenase [Bartonella]|uniref:glutamate-5-semialdehyde dehydrogenase n=1 Tax=Bartonella TaxID=773 RepID=UPI0018DB64B6|nr:MULTISPECIES: glutamate-5-semialdehyde dehydrogenase [Bartonella]MBH9974291.1 glutamate-5-semialdehyde dehydrogenase [Bartonella choladocola]MBI0013898.1 glutamate-5-semialdehyde dehydrogenase [Bartonella sp. B10834G3]